MTGGGDSVKWMSYFDEIEAMCAVQAAFSSRSSAVHADKFSFLPSPNAANYANYVKEMGGAHPTASFSSLPVFDRYASTVSTPRLKSISTDSNTNLADTFVHLHSNRSCLNSPCHTNCDGIRDDNGDGDASIPAFIGDDTDNNSLSYDDDHDINYESNYSNNNNNIIDDEMQDSTNNENFIDFDEKPRKGSGVNFSWSAHVRTMCEMCGDNVKLDKDRVCSDGYNPTKVKNILSYNRNIADISTLYSFFFDHFLPSLLFIFFLSLLFVQSTSTIIFISFLYLIYPYEDGKVLLIT